MNDTRSLEPDDDSFLLKEKAENKSLFWICSIFVGGVLSLSLAFCLYSVYRNASWSLDEYSTQSYPIKGQYSSISSVKTQWISEDNPSTPDELSDKSFYPVAHITLEDTNQSGQIRCYYLDSEDTYIGDPVTKNFHNGMFKEGNQFSFRCVKGIDSRSGFSAYFSGYMKPWHLVILEGSPRSRTMSDYTELAKIPVYAELPE